MTIVWSVSALITGHESVQFVAGGSAGTGKLAAALAEAALLAGARELGRCEFWVTIDGAALMVVPGLECAGVVDVAGLRGALDPYPRLGRP